MKGAAGLALAFGVLVLYVGARLIGLAVHRALLRAVKRAATVRLAVTMVALGTAATLAGIAVLTRG